MVSTRDSIKPFDDSSLEDYSNNHSTFYDDPLEQKTNMVKTVDSINENRQRGIQTNRNIGILRKAKNKLKRNKRLPSYKNESSFTGVQNSRNYPISEHVSEVRSHSTNGIDRDQNLNPIQNNISLMNKESGHLLKQNLKNKHLYLNQSFDENRIRKTDQYKIKCNCNGYNKTSLKRDEMVNSSSQTGREYYFVLRSRRKRLSEQGVPVNNKLLLSEDQD